MSKNKGDSLAQSVPSPSDSERDYETEGHLRTLGDAADIMANPSKLKKVHKLAGRKHKAVMGFLSKHLPDAGSEKIDSLDKLKKKAYAKNNEPDDAV